MEQNTPKFHLRLNLFDGIVLLLALAVGGFLLWNSRSTASVPLASSATVRYTVRFLNWPEENVSRIREGGLLVDNVKKYEIGRVVSYEVEPAITLLLDHERRTRGHPGNGGRPLYRQRGVPPGGGRLRPPGGAGRLYQRGGLYGQRTHCGN